MTSTNNNPRAVCPVCGRTVETHRVGGVLRLQAHTKQTGSFLPCDQGGAPVDRSDSPTTGHRTGEEHPRMGLCSVCGASVVLLAGDVAEGHEDSQDEPCPGMGRPSAARAAADDAAQRLVRLADRKTGEDSQANVAEAAQHAYEAAAWAADRALECAGLAKADRNRAVREASPLREQACKAAREADAAAKGAEQAASLAREAAESAEEARDKANEAENDQDAEKATAQAAQDAEDATRLLADAQNARWRAAAALRAVVRSLRG